MKTNVLEFIFKMGAAFLHSPFSQWPLAVSALPPDNGVGKSNALHRTQRGPYALGGLIVAALLMLPSMHAAQHVWSGASGNKLFSNPGNWSSGGVPQPWEQFAKITFPSNGTDTAIVDINGLQVDHLTVGRHNFKLGATNGAKINLTSSTLYSQVDITHTNAQFLSSLELVIATDGSNGLCYFDSIGMNTVQLDCKFSGGSLVLSGDGKFTIAGPNPNTHAGTSIGSGTRVFLAKPAGTVALPGKVIAQGWYEDAWYNFWDGGRLEWRASHQLSDNGELQLNNCITDLNGYSETVGRLSVNGAIITNFGVGTLTLNDDLSGTSGSSDGWDYLPGGTILGRLNLGTLQYRESARVMSGDLVINATIIAPAGGTPIDKQGDGMLRLNVANSYNADTFVTGGSLTLGTNGTLGSGPSRLVVGPEGSLIFTVSKQISNPVTLLGSTNGLEKFQVVIDTDSPVWTRMGTFTGPVTITNSVGLHVNGPYSLTNNSGINFAGPISGSGGFDKSGGGTLFFTGTANNSYTGGTRIHGGHFSLQRVNGALSIPGALTLSDEPSGYGYWGAYYADRSVISYFGHQIADTAAITILRPSSFVYFDDCNDTVGNIVLAGAWMGSGSGVLTLNGNVTTLAAVTTSYLSGNVNLGSTLKTFDIEDGFASLDFTIYAPVSGSLYGALNKTGPGVMKMISSGTYQGWTYISEGKLSIAHPGVLGVPTSGTVVYSNAVLDLAFPTPGILAEGLTLAGGQLVNASALTNICGGPVNLQHHSRIDVEDTFGCVQFTNTMSGWGTFTKAGFGAMEFGGSASNTYSGVTWIENGPLRLKKPSGVVAISGSQLQLVPKPNPVNPPLVDLFAAEQIGNACAVNVSSNSTLRHNSWSDTIGSLSGNGSVNIGSGILSIGANNMNTEFSGVISGPAGIVYKIGSGTLTLTGTNTYGANTLIQGGTLMVNGQLAGATHVSSNAVLAGRGRVGILGASNGRIAPGATVGRLTASNPSFGAQSVLAFELNGTTPGVNCDVLEAIGTVNLGGATLNASLGYAGGVSNKFVLINNDGSDGITGTFAGLPEGASLTLNGAQFKISYKGGVGSNDVVLTQLSVSTPPKSSGITKLPNGQMQIGGDGIAGQLYNVQANVNLNTTNWLLIGSATADAGGKFSFIDTNAPNFPMRFYRFVIP